MHRQSHGTEDEPVGRRTAPAPRGETADSSSRNGVGPETVGRRVREERLRQNVGVRELARRVRVSASLISQVELGKASPSVGTLYAIVNELGLSLDELLLDRPGAPRRADGEVGAAEGRRGEGGGREGRGGEGRGGEGGGGEGGGGDGGGREVGAGVGKRGGNLDQRIDPRGNLDQRVDPRPSPPRGADALGAATPDEALGAETPDDSVDPVVRRGAGKVIHLASGVHWERLTPQTPQDVDFLSLRYDVGGASCSEDSLMRHSGHEYGHVVAGWLGVTVGFETYELGPGDSISFDSTMPHRLFNLGREPVQAIWFVVGRRGDPRIVRG